MLSDYFLDRCLIACCSLESNNNSSSDILNGIYFILKWYKEESTSKKDEQETPVEFKEKVDIIYLISQYRCVNKSSFRFEQFIDKMRSGKFSQLIPILESKRLTLTDDEVIELKTDILAKKKLCEMMQGKKNFQKMMADIEAGNYVDEEEAISMWESQICKSYSTLQKINAQKMVDEAVSLNLLDDDYDPVLSKLRETLDPENTLKTGYPSIDSSLPANGFEVRRLYLIGGPSGVGKSAMMLNILSNSISRKRADNTELEVYIYITAENLIDESLLRFYCCSTGNPSRDVVEKLKADKSFSLKPDLQQIMVDSNTLVIFKYVEPKVTKVQVIESIVSQLSEQYKNRVKGVFVDYIDLLSPNDYTANSDNLRLAQGEISQELKNIAVKYSTTMVTVTQLNRSGYDKLSAPDLTQVGESMKKGDNSDFVLFIQKTKDPILTMTTPAGSKTYEKSRMTVIKNRNGSVGKTVQLAKATLLNNKDIFNYKFEELPSVMINANSDLDDDDELEF